MGANIFYDWYKLVKNISTKKQNKTEKCNDLENTCFVSLLE